MAASQRYTQYPIPETLHQALQVYAIEQEQSTKEAKQALLRSAFAELPAEPPAEVIEHYLRHNDIQSPIIEKHNSAFERDIAMQLQSTAATWSRIVMDSIRPGLVVQALLWNKLKPDAPHTRAQAARTSQAQTSTTIRIPEILNTELLGTANQQAINLTQLVDAYLTRALDTLQHARTHGELLLPDMMTRYPAPSTPSRQDTTIRISRLLDGRLRAEELIWAHEGYLWKKTAIVVSLLQYALDEQSPTTPSAPQNQLVLIDGELYARVQNLMIRQRRVTGRTITIREMINGYVQQGLAHDETAEQPKRQRNS